MDDQIAKADCGKPQLSFVPTEIIRCIARIREYENKKYGSSENWRTVEKRRYVDAAYRHFLAYVENPNGVDEESGLPHLWHLTRNVAFLCEMEKEQSIKTLGQAMTAMAEAATAAQNVIAAFEKTKEILIDENKKN